MSEAELEFRAAEQVAVSFPKRTIELIVMPYEKPTAVSYRGREIVEVCSRGAYGGVEERTGQIRVNRDHKVERTVGRAVALHPSREEGLVAEIKISRTELGEETLVLADDECLDASAGFGLLRDKQTGRVRPDAEVWETRERRRLNHLFLDHIALTPSPAYEDARVLAVRHHDAAVSPQEPRRGDETPKPTPNLDRIELEALRASYALLDFKYGLRR